MTLSIEVSLFMAPLSSVIIPHMGAETVSACVVARGNAREDAGCEHRVKHPRAARERARQPVQHRHRRAQSRDAGADSLWRSRGAPGVDHGGAGGEYVAVGEVDWLRSERR